MQAYRSVIEGRVRRAVAIAVAVSALGYGGFAAAGVGVGGRSGGTFARGQTLSVTVSDAFSGSAPGGPPYGWCDDSAQKWATGWFSVGSLSPSSGGHKVDLSVSCQPTGPNTGTWQYTGSVTVTVPDDAPSSMPVSVAVEEIVPLQLASDTGCSCTHQEDYNFNQTYTVAAPSTTAAAPQTTTATTATTTTTVTVTVPTTTVTTTVEAPTPPPFGIVVPSTITTRPSGASVVLEIRSSRTDVPQTLCWADHGVKRCTVGNGTWRIKLRAVSGRRVFTLTANGEVVARRTVEIRVKRG